MKRTIHWVSVILALFLVLNLAGCGQSEPVKHVTLSNLEPVSSPVQGSKETLRVALAVGLSPT